ncbi:hypothetical protein CJU76_22995 [Pseudomonas fragi]|nr:hypothetical protein CJU76_22995 [Pseudomonas fragi]
MSIQDNRNFVDIQIRSYGTIFSVLIGLVKLDRLVNTDAFADLFALVARESPNKFSNVLKYA